MSLADDIDRLIVVNLKIWHLMEEMKKLAKDERDFPNRSAVAMLQLNRERSDLMGKIDKRKRYKTYG